MQRQDSAPSNGNKRNPDPSQQVAATEDEFVSASGGGGLEYTGDDVAEDARDAGPTGAQGADSSGAKPYAPDDEDDTSKQVFQSDGH